MSRKPRKDWRTYPLCMVNHPERGRYPERTSPTVIQIVFTSAWVPDETHPLGGYEGEVVLFRRVNLVKDKLPGWYRRTRPLYEFTKEQPS
jgi:hypothetical protein